MSEREEELEDFAKWVASWIFDPQFEEGGQGAFIELACRRLNKLGIVGKSDDKWLFLKEDDAEA